jgi:hypothetical protein
MIMLHNHVGGYQHLGKPAAPTLYPEDGGSTFLQNVGNHLQNYTALQPVTPIPKFHYHVF